MKLYIPNPVLTPSLPPTLFLLYLLSHPTPHSFPRGNKAFHGEIKKTSALWGWTRVDVMFFLYFTLSLRCLLYFSYERQKMNGYGWERHWERLEGRTVFRLYCMIKEYTLNKRRKQINRHWDYRKLRMVAIIQCSTLLKLLKLMFTTPDQCLQEWIIILTVGKLKIKLKLKAFEYYNAVEIGQLYEIKN